MASIGWRIWPLRTAILRARKQKWIDDLPPGTICGEQTKSAVGRPKADLKRPLDHRLIYKGQVFPLAVVTFVAGGGFRWTCHVAGSELAKPFGGKAMVANNSIS